MNVLFHPDGVLFMLRFVHFVLWVLVVLALVVGFDRVMHQFEFTTPGLKQTQEFYVDFRKRLIGLVANSGESKSIEGVIDDSRERSRGRYLYVDDSGVLQFVDSQDAVPARFRSSAQPLAD
jgi:hypothetical protein